MAEDVLSLVKSAEEKADDLVANAKREANKIIDDSKAQGQDKYNQIIKDAKSKALELVEEAKRKAQSDKEPIIAEAKNKSLEISNQDDSKINRVIDGLIERIVENGNS